MSALYSSATNSKRSLTFNKSFILSILIHSFLIFGISITTYYKLPLLQESPIINVKFANSNQDIMTNTNIENVQDFSKDFSNSENGNMKSSKKMSQSFKIKKLEANSIVNSEEAVYLNLWQRQIESTGDNIISENESYFDGKVQIMATIDIYGNLINSKILISSGNNIIDEMAIKILQESAPFAPFNKSMSSEYSCLLYTSDAADE